MPALGLGEGARQCRYLLLTVRGSASDQRPENRDDALGSLAVDGVLPGKLGECDVGHVPDEQRLLAKRQKILLHIVEMARDIRAEEADHRRGGDTPDAAGPGGPHSPTIPTPAITATTRPNQ